MAVNAVQIAYSGTGDKMWFRSCNNNTWSAWLDVSRFISSVKLTGDIAGTGTPSASGVVNIDTTLQTTDHATSLKLSGDVTGKATLPSGITSIATTKNSSLTSWNVSSIKLVGDVTGAVTLPSGAVDNYIADAPKKITLTGDVNGSITI